MRRAADREGKTESIIALARRHKTAGTTLTISEFKKLIRSDGSTIRKALESVDGEDLSSVIKINTGKEFY